jgi:hypothetical protein
MLLDDIKSDILTSLKKGDANRVDTLRFLVSAVRNTAIDKYGAAGESALKDQDVLDVIKKQVKTHKESVEAFEKGNRPELVEKEKAQLVVLEAFLPSQMSDDDLKALLAPVAASGEPNFGLLMKQAMMAVKGQADGSRVSSVLKSLMQKGTN